jgi:hypothetical protein
MPEAAAAAPPPSAAADPAAASPAPAQPAAASPAAASPGAAPAASLSAPPAAPPAARPDYLPETFWDAEAGQAKVEALAKAHAELGQRFAKGKDGIAEELRAEITAELRKGVPETPDAYAVAPPAEGVPDHLVLLTEAPGADFVPEEGKAYFLLDPKSPLLGWWKQVAHEAGLSQEKFSAGLAQFAAAQAQRTPTRAERAEAASRFYASLGDNGQKRVAHLAGQLKGMVGAERMPVLDAFVEWGGKAAVETLEALADRSGGPRFAPGGAGGPAELTEAKLNEMMQDPRYHRDRDPAFIAQVTEGFRKLYPGRVRAA